MKLHILTACFGRQTSQQFQASFLRKDMVCLFSYHDKCDWQSNCVNAQCYSIKFLLELRLPSWKLTGILESGDSTAFRFCSVSDVTKICLLARRTQTQTPPTHTHVNLTVSLLAGDLRTWSNHRLCWHASAEARQVWCPCDVFLVSRPASPCLEREGQQCLSAPTTSVYK